MAFSEVRDISSALTAELAGLDCLQRFLWMCEVLKSLAEEFQAGRLGRLYFESVSNSQRLIRA